MVYIKSNKEAYTNNNKYSFLYRIVLNKIEYNLEFFLKFKILIKNIINNIIIIGIAYKLLKNPGSITLLKSIAC